MFKVVELEKGRPATFKSGGDERPVVIRQKEFALAIPFIKDWGVQIEGKPNEIFDEISKGAGKIGFDPFAHWALKLSLGFVDPPKSPGSL